MLDAVREAGDDEVLTSFLEQYYTQAASIPREVYIPSATLDSGRPGGVPGRAARRPGPPPRAAAWREARAAVARDAERGGNARSRAGALAGRPGQDAGRARGARRGPRSAGPAAADRVLRHQQLPGQRVGRQHGRVRGRQAAFRRVPPLPDQDRHRAQRLRVAPGGAATALPGRSGGRGGERGGAPLGDAGPRAHRRRQGPGQRHQGDARRDRASTTCHWPGWPRNARSCSCPDARSRSSCRRPHRRSTWSSGCATRPTGLPSPTIAASARNGASDRRSTTCPASVRNASGSCSRCSARSSASVTRRSSRSPPCRGSDPRWRPGSRRPWRPDRAREGARRPVGGRSV